MFNTNENNFCDFCDAGQFIRKEQYTQHKKSNNHIYKAVKAGRASRNEIDKYNALMESKERSKSLLRLQNKENHKNSGSNTSESSYTSYEFIISEVSNNKQQSLDSSKNNKRKSGDIQGTPTYSRDAYILNIKKYEKKKKYIKKKQSCEPFWLRKDRKKYRKTNYFASFIS